MAPLTRGQVKQVCVADETHELLVELAARIEAEQVSVRRCSYAEAVHVAVVEAMKRRDRRDKRQKRKEAKADD